MILLRVPLSACCRKIYDPHSPVAPGPYQHTMHYSLMWVIYSFLRQETQCNLWRYYYVTGSRTNSLICRVHVNFMFSCWKYGCNITNFMIFTFQLWKFIKNLKIDELHPYFQHENMKLVWKWQIKLQWQILSTF